MTLNDKIKRSKPLDDELGDLGDLDLSLDDLIGKDEDIELEEPKKFEPSREEKDDSKISFEDKIVFDDEDEDEEEGVPAKPKGKKKKSIKQEEYEDEEDSGISVSSMLSENLPKLIIAVVMICLCVVFACISSCSKKLEEQKKQTVTASVSSSKSQQVKTVEKTKIETVTVWDTKAELVYDEYVEMPEKYYSDEMIVSKFIVQDEACRSYYFSGIPKNFKKKITFPVTYTEYNSIASGSKIFVDYKVQKIDGKSVIVSIVTSIKE